MTGMSRPKAISLKTGKAEVMAPSGNASGQQATMGRVKDRDELQLLQAELVRMHQPAQDLTLQQRQQRQPTRSARSSANPMRSGTTHT